MSQITKYRPSITDEEYEELKDLFFDKRKLFTKEQLIDARENHPLDKSPSFGPMYSATAKFLFRCEICTKLGLNTQWYQIIIKTIGGPPSLHSGTMLDDVIEGFNGSNIMKIPKNYDRDNLQSSGLTYIRGEGYVCDHCMISIFEE